VCRRARAAVTVVLPWPEAGAATNRAGHRAGRAGGFSGWNQARRGCRLTTSPTMVSAGGDAGGLDRRPDRPDRR
jgi:hypothetical protein